MKHEIPWRTEQWKAYLSGYTDIASGVPTVPQIVAREVSTQDAERIIVTINACEGLPLDTLLTNPLKPLMLTIKSMLEDYQSDLNVDMAEATDSDDMDHFRATSDSVSDIVDTLDKFLLRENCGCCDKLIPWGEDFCPDCGCDRKGFMRENGPSDDNQVMDSDQYDEDKPEY